MARYAQVDQGVVTGVLYTSGELDPATFPLGRRFLILGDGPDPELLSQVVVANDRGDRLVPLSPAVSVTPPAPQPPRVDPLAVKLEEILTEVKRIAPPVVEPIR